jgi:RNA-directed DNA polymerase
LAKVRKIVKINSDKKTEELIKQLNPVIRGWANYHRHIVASKTFSYVDYNIFKCIWRWAKRRHPQKGNLWIRRKYFSKGFHNWTLSTAVLEEGKTRIYELTKAAYIPIRRYVKVRSKAHPYDPEYEPYFEKRNLLKYQEQPPNRSKLSAHSTGNNST